MKNELKRQVKKTIEKADGPLETTEVRNSLNQKTISLGKVKRRLEKLAKENKIERKKVGPGTWIWWKKGVF